MTQIATIPSPATIAARRRLISRSADPRATAAAMIASTTNTEPQASVMLCEPVSNTTASTNAATGPARQRGARSSHQPAASTSGMADVAMNSGHVPRA